MGPKVPQRARKDKMPNNSTAMAEDRLPWASDVCAVFMNVLKKD